MKKQAGFTLIELAIVLVIIGLLLGGVLKGQELINSAKVKNMTSDFRNTPLYLYGYQDKFKVLPGDDHAAPAHVAGTNATSGTQTQNGVIQGEWDSILPADESFVFWNHVRLAGLAPGPTSLADANYPPRNTEGGRLGVQSVSGMTEITGMSGIHAICSDGILGKFAKQLDLTLDDGETSTGSLRAVVSGTPGAGVTTASITPAQESAAYTVCMSF